MCYLGVRTSPRGSMLTLSRNYIMMRSSFHQTKLATVNKARTAGPRSAIKTVNIQTVANGGHYNVLVCERERD
jgi:hypothetical protein